MTVDGGFADNVVNHVSTLDRSPHAVSFDDAALLTTVGMVAHALDVLDSPIVGAREAVAGPVPIGLRAVQIVRELGTSLMAPIRRRDEKLSIGPLFGSDLTVNATLADPVAAIRSDTEGVGVDIVLECSASSVAVDQALPMTQRGGSVVVVGFFDEPVTAQLNIGITLHSVRSEGTGSLGRAVTQAGQQRLRLSELVTHHFPLTAINEAFSTYADRNSRAIKVILDVNQR